MTWRFDVCVVGSANLDLVATTDRLPGPGETVLGSSYGARAVVVTLGARGAKLCTSGADDAVVAAFAVESVDTTAAGDAFCGGFAAELAAGASLAGTLRFAAATGALATTRAGAVPSLPTRPEIDALLTRPG